jgi:membrane protein
LFASIVVVVGLLIWLNLIARLTLIAAAWAANDVDEIHSREDGPVAADHGSEAVPVPGSTAAREALLPTFGTRSGDRTTLAAGAVLGATAVMAAGALARGIRSAVGLARR